MYFRYETGIVLIMRQRRNAKCHSYVGNCNPRVGPAKKIRIIRISGQRLLVRQRESSGVWQMIRDVENAAWLT